MNVEQTNSVNTPRPYRRLGAVDRADLAMFANNVHAVGTIVLLEDGRICIGARAVLESKETSIQLLAHAGSTIDIGANVYIGPGAIISAHGVVRIEHGAVISAGARLIDDASRHGIVVGADARIEDDVMLLAGASIGRNAVIRRGCVVSGDVPDGAELRAAGSRGETEVLEHLTSSPTGSIRDDDSLLARVRRSIAHRLPDVATCDPATPLEDIASVSSLVLLHVLVELEHEFTVTLPISMVRTSDSLNDLCSLILELRAKMPSDGPALSRGADAVPALESPQPRSRLSAARDDLSSIRVRGALRRLSLACTNALPIWTMPFTRIAFLRFAGIAVPSGSRFLGRVHVIGTARAAERLIVGTGVVIGHDVTFGLDATIEIGRNVSVGPYCRLYTGTHQIGPHHRRMDPAVVARPIVVDEGAWIGMGAVILPGVRLGRGCIVSACAVVTTDVPDDTIVAGNPATVLQALPA